MPRADPFVGRERELHRLRELLHLANRGSPQLVLLSGDAGVGKSRLLRELTPYAVAAGVHVLRGACQEDVAVPYLPVASALAPLSRAEAVDPFDAFATAAAARADADPGTTRAGSDAHLRLFLAVSGMLLSTTRARPVLLIIEDAHWVDAATLGLLRHLLGVVAEEGADVRARLMIVVTTRAPDATTASGVFVQRLARQPGTTHIALGLLDEHEARELVAAWLGHEPTATMIDRLMESTAGQPLLLHSVLERLGDLSSIDDSALANLLGPTDLDQELWHRIDALSPATRELVLNAAFLGDGHRLAVLAATCDADADVLPVLLDDATRHRVLLTDDERYHFDHPQLRQLVYHWPDGRERAERHLVLADRLETLDVDAIVFAHHLARAHALVEPERLLQVCGLAADRTAAMGAWLEAARYASVALGAAPELDLSAEDLAALQFRAGYTALTAGDRETGIRLLTTTVETARECGAFAIWGRALVHLGRLGSLTTDLRAANMRTIARLDEFLAATDNRVPAVRAEVHALVSELYSDVNEVAAAGRHAVEAETLAREIEDDDLRVRVGFATGLHRLGEAELVDADDRFRSASVAARSLVDLTPLAWCLTRQGLVGYLRGRLDSTDEILFDALAAARNAENGAEYSLASAIAASVAAMRGDAELVEIHGERATRAYERAAFAFTPRMLYPALAATRAARGDRAGAHAALDALDSIRDRASRRYRPLVDMLAGDLDAATAALDASTFRIFSDLPAANYLTAGAVAAQVELGALARRPALVRGPVATLVDLYERGMRFTTGWPAFVPRVIALGMDVLDRHDDAERWFTRAAADARAAGAPPEIGRTALDQARLLFAREPRDEERAEALAAVARAAYDSINMTPWVAGSELLRGRTSFRDAGPDPRAVTRVVLVTDIVSSTALNYRVGDPAYTRVVEEHNDIVRRALAHHDGTVFKEVGDGIGAWFYSVHSALRCAAELRDDFAPAGGDPNASIQVRIALTVGEPTPVGTDLLGIDVTLAFRAIGIAIPGEITVTQSVANLAPRAWGFEPRGRHLLKGIGEPVDLFSAHAL